MNLSLSDIVPPLRWTAPSQVEPIASDPRLPDAWWQALPLDRACAVIGIPQVAARLADLAVSAWNHIVLGDVLPLLRFTDPESSRRTPGDRETVLRLFSDVLDRLMASETGQSPADTAARAERSLPELIDDLFAGLDEPRLAIAKDRVYAEHRVTLDELAQRFSVTRERIRQIERDLRDHVENALGRPEAAPLAAHLTWLRGRLGSAVPAEDLAAAVPWHQTELRTLGVPAWRFVRTLLTEYEQVDGWLIAGGADELREKTRQLFTEGPVKVADAVGLVAQLGVREDVAERWLASVPNLRVLDGHVVPWPRSAGDKAEAVLAVAGEPLTPEQIQERIGEDYSLVGIRNQLTSDERFLRVDHNKYGLRRWGGEEYLGVREMIAREGEMPAAEAPAGSIMGDLTGRYGVAESPMRGYPGAPGFEPTQRGWTRVGQEPDPYQQRRDVSRTLRCFRSRDGRWWHRVDITADHLRGSGFPIPVGFAAHLGLAPGGQLTTSTPSGDVVVGWQSQPTMGSIRNILQEYNAMEGDHVFLTVSDAGELLTRFLPAASPQLPPLNRALHLIGYTAPVASEAEGLRLIGARIGLAEGAAKEEILAVLRERGDHDILACLDPTAA
jgi:DNA-directed RNA polymerase, sigma subunit (sigma70/sigma32)